MAEQYDIIIIGAGLVGAMTARFLSQYELDILLIDKAADVGTETSSGNSAIVHAGYDAHHGTLKSEMSVEGNRLWGTVAQELNISFKRCGAYVVAVGRRGFSADDRGVGWLVALDSDGQKRWEQTYPQDGWNWHHGIASVDTGYVLVGTRAAEPDTDADARGAWLLRVDAEGQVVWEHQAEPGTGGFAVQPLGDGGLLVGGAASTDGHAGEVAWLAKVGGDPTSGTTAEDVLSLPTLPDWTTPLVAGTVIGALGARAVASWRQS